MRTLSYVLAAVLAGFGFIFVAGAQGQAMRLVVGVILFGAAGMLVYLTRVKPGATTIRQQIDLGGDVDLVDLPCKACGGRLTEKSISIQAGAVFIRCEYCGAAYQLEEKPKW